MSRSDDLRSPEVSEDRPAMEVLDGAVGASSQRSVKGRLFRGSIYALLMIVAAVLMTVSIVPELASDFFPDKNSRRTQQMAEAGEKWAEQRARQRQHANDEIKAGIRELGGRWNSTTERVSFSGTDISDADLETLKWPDAVTRLSLSGTQVTDDGLKHLPWIVPLDKLRVTNSQVTGARLGRMGYAFSPRTLNLNGTQVTDAAISTLKQMPALQVLDIANTQVTAAGLTQLQEFKNLRSLSVSTNLMTEAAIEQLEAALPECRIMRID